MLCCAFLSNDSDSLTVFVIRADALLYYERLIITILLLTSGISAVLCRQDFILLSFCCGQKLNSGRNLHNKRNSGKIDGVEVLWVKFAPRGCRKNQIEPQKYTKLSSGIHKFGHKYSRPRLERFSQTVFRANF